MAFKAQQHKDSRSRSKTPFAELLRASRGGSLKANASAAQLKANIRRGMAFLIAAALTLSIAGCGSAGTSPSPRTLTSLAVTPANSSIIVGSTQQLTATGTYSDGSTSNLTSSASWASSDSSITTVSSSGLATSLALGTAVVTATSGSINNHTNPTVSPALVSIAVTPAGPSILVNGTQQFTATGAYTDSSHQDITGNVTWSSSDTLATVNAAGLATGVAAGNVNIRAASGSISGSTSLTVNPILVSLTVTTADSTIDINTTTQFTATGNFSDGSAQDYTQLVSWSAPGSIASMDNTGLATGLAIGTVSVIANYGSISGSANLHVTAPTLLSILVSPVAASVPLGISQSFTATGVFSKGDSQDLAAAVWSSSDSTEVPIDSSGSAQTLAVNGDHLRHLRIYHGKHEFHGAASGAGLDRGESFESIHRSGNDRAAHARGNIYRWQHSDTLAGAMEFRRSHGGLCRRQRERPGHGKCHWLSKYFGDFRLGYRFHFDYRHSGCN